MVESTQEPASREAGGREQSASVPLSPGRPPPKVWQFSERDRERFGRRYWMMPHRLVKEGLWKKLWRNDASRRGGGACSSVLPVLAVHTWPYDSVDLDARAVDGDKGIWTRWAYLSVRQIAALAGVDKDTVSRAIRILEAMGLLRRGPDGRGHGLRYCLLRDLYPRADDQMSYATVPANLFYGGAWSLLPTSAARHLYIVLAGLDPISDEERYVDRVQRNEPVHGLDEDDPPEWGRYTEEDRQQLRRQAVLAPIRATNALSRRQLVEISGLSLSTLKDALNVLTAPLLGDESYEEGPTEMWRPIAMVAHGRNPTWYAPDRAALDCHMDPEVLNDPKKVYEFRFQNWPLRYF